MSVTKYSYSLEARQEELERLILIEKGKQVRQFTEQEVREYYEQTLRMEPQMLINFLIDKIEIYYTSPITKSPDDGQGFCIDKGITRLQDVKITFAIYD